MGNLKWKMSDIKAKGIHVSNGKGSKLVPAKKATKKIVIKPVSNRIIIKPLSVNSAWQGKRFKTDKYKKFEQACLLLLPEITLPPSPFEIFYKFGFSSTLSDLGNPEKLITDILCKKYNFNDRHIYKIVMEKEITSKGEEFIEFQITHYKNN